MRLARESNLRFAGVRPRDFLSAGCALLLLCRLVCASNTTALAASKPASPPHAAHRKSHKKIASWRRGQRKIDSQRTREIQQALIREHYLEGKASGVWDTASQRAMEKYQADNGWQSKMVPDSRALIKLGLGPDHEHLLNPDSAMTEPQGLHTAPASNASITSVKAVPEKGNDPER
jgi:peptidoglycan hydrolase-like protein with peptidoglycan-binding domain